MAKHNVGITVSAKDLASGVIQRVSARTIALGVAMGNLASKMISAAINGIRGWIDEAIEAEKANVMLDAALRGTGQYTEEVAGKMKDLANAIQDETGASDESVKANIALLTSLGVSSNKMGEAARAVQALSALNYEGSMAAKAVALAMEGNMDGFSRMIPALKNATTETEKVEAVNRVLAAGYAQQKANLNTVGGAWEALKGRIGDAREDIVGAIFEGLDLGKTFDNMQAAVGRFLKSDTFKGFTEELKSGAAYVKQIIEAMGTDGGTKEVFGAVGEIILGALKDGADYVGTKISEAFGQKRLDKLDPRLAEAARFWGAKSGGASWGEAISAMSETKGESQGGGHMAEGIAHLNAITSRRVPVANEIAAVEKSIESTLEKTEDEMFDIEEAQWRDYESKLNIAAYDLARESNAKDIKETEEAISNAADREQSAKDEIASIEEQRAGLLKQSINDWIKGQQDTEKQKEELDKDDLKAKKKASRLRHKRDAGTHLSTADEDWLNKFDKNDLLKREGGDELNAAEMAQKSKEEQDKLNAELMNLQKEQNETLKSIETYLKGNLEVE